MQLRHQSVGCLATRKRGYGHAQVACRAQISRRDVLLGTASTSLLLCSDIPAALAAQTAYDFEAVMRGEARSLADYKGQNVNYPGLRGLYDKYKADGFNLIAFPCNQFGGQAPGTSEEERAWAHKKFKFEFDVFDKIDVNGPNTHPLYKFMKAQQPIALPGAQPSRPNGDVAWNYEKMIWDRQGQTVRRYKSTFNPADFESDIRLLLAGKEPLPSECIMHPGRIVCNVEKILAA